MFNKPIGFIGAGQMATALAQGFVKAGLVSASQLAAADPSPEARARFAAATGGTTSADNRSVAQAAEVLFLAVKPQQMAAALAEIKPALSHKPLVISIAAGIRLSVLADALSAGARLVRVMPNTPCLVGQGASAYCLGEGLGNADAEVVETLLKSVGVVCRVEEKLMDAVTGLSGSGPAFVYLVIEALADGGVRVGLPRATALALAAQTVKGAAEMVLAGDHPAVLKDRVTSPGGTTIAGLQTLEAHGVRGAVMGAVEAAARRSAELAAGSSSK